MRGRLSEVGGVGPELCSRYAEENGDLAALGKEVGLGSLMSEAFEVIWMDEDLLADAKRIFEKYADHELSLRDCASAATIRARKIRLAFAFDRDFETLGFELAT